MSLQASLAFPYRRECRNPSASVSLAAGPLVFDEYGQVKYQIRTTLEETDRQTKRLKYLWETGYFDRPTDSTSNFAALHLAPRWIRRLPMSPNLKSPKSVTIRSYHVGVRR